MGKIVLALICLVVGLFIGTMFGGALIGGSAAGIGIATGLGAGVCSTVQAAQDEGIMTPEQVDQVLNRAAADLAAMSGTGTPAAIVGSAAECSEVLARLMAAATE
ncbi:hypothetical protein QO034_14375 [Sedimentitalea sp. JM2-8]|uniref:Uncharacterized protein n=1 Tax=Sedimentitalea xiamensis TaxID=3050037 RepID=A0ABT7FHM9_9RHOB|nr:hypothetical protein [Sedimentitalea xiamensis]MDK3074294.1 hypothetical protein [Sedimentitalea xiamensis]